MGVSSRTEIQNSALIKLGAETINSEDDENTRARLIKVQYPIIRDRVLRSHPWKFARGRVALSPIDPLADEYFEWGYSFQLPTDCLRVIETDIPDGGLWDVEDRILLANEPTVIIKYIKRVTDVSKYDDNFCEVVAWELASDIAFLLTGNVAREVSTKESAKKAMQEARSFNAQQGNTDRVSSEAWVNSRQY